MGWKATDDPAELERRREYSRSKTAAHRARMSEEQRAEARRKSAENANRWYHSMPKEEQAARRKRNQPKQKEWDKANTEKMREYMRSWEKRRVRVITEEQKKKWGENSKRRYWEDPEHHRMLSRIHASKRRAALKGSGGGITKSEVDALYEKQGHKCATCKCQVFKTGPSRFEMDHVIPLKKKGPHHIDNIQLLCLRCNRRKAAKDPEVWAQMHGLLFC